MSYIAKTVEAILLMVIDTPNQPPKTWQHFRSMIYSYSLYMSKSLIIMIIIKTLINMY